MDDDVMKISNPTHLKLAIAGLFCLLVLGFLFSGNAGEKPVPAQEDQPTKALAKQDYNVWRSMLALALVLGGLTGVNWYLKNRANQPVGAKGTRRLRVIERFAIDQKRCLLLVSLDGKEFLVGVGNDQISVLHGGQSPAAASPEGAS
jgi:flagellar biogenesis protein FliO